MNDSCNAREHSNANVRMQNPKCKNYPQMQILRVRKTRCEGNNQIKINAPHKYKSQTATKPKINTQQTMQLADFRTSG